MGIACLVRNKANDKLHVGLTAALHKRARKTQSVSMMTLDGIIVKIFESAKLAASEISGSESKISGCYRGGRKIHKGYTWCYFSPQKGE